MIVLEKEMATHSSVLAWRIPGTGEPGGLLSMGSHRVRHDWSDLADDSLFFQFLLEIHWILHFEWIVKYTSAFLFIFSRVNWTWQHYSYKIYKGYFALKCFLCTVSISFGLDATQCAWYKTTFYKICKFVEEMMGERNGKS